MSESFERSHRIALDELTLGIESELQYCSHNLTLTPHTSSPKVGTGRPYWSTKPEVMLETFGRSPMQVACHPVLSKLLMISALFVVSFAMVLCYDSSR